MMFLSAAILSLIGLAASTPSPLSSRQATPNYPEKSTSSGFYLVVNVTDLSTDFDPPIHNTYITNIHITAAGNLMGQIPSIGSARIFYQNGTAEQQQLNQSNVLFDSGQNSAPSGIQLADDDGDSGTAETVYINGTTGQAGIRVSSSPEPYALLEPGPWVACNESVEARQGDYFVIFKKVNMPNDDSDPDNVNISEGCVPVRLLSECAELPALNGTPISSHEYVIESECYPNVTSLDWTLYGP